MADKNLLEQMLERLVNDDKQKAEELFHEYVVSKSREIYETLIESEMDEEEEKEKEKEEKKEDDDLDENFEDLAYEADDEKGPMGDMGDDLEGQLDAEMGPEEDEFADKDPEELFQDLDAIVGELQAKFDAMNGEGGDMGGDDMGGMGDDEEMKDDMELETVREYVERVPAGHGAEKKGQAEKADGSAGGMKFSKNDMGGTSANILSGRNGAEAGLANQGELKGSGLLKGKPQDMKTGNLNTVGGFKGDAFKKNGAGHGAEKKGSAEGSTDGTSLFRGRR